MSGPGSHLRRIVEHLVTTLVDSGQLELVPTAKPAVLVDEVLVAIGKAGQFSQAGSTIARALVDSSLVEEVYADDAEILSVFNHMFG